MKITKFEKQKNSERISIFVDEKYSFSLSVDNFLENNIYLNKEISQNEIEVLKDKDELSKAFSYILYQLGFGIKTEQELIKKLNNKNYSQKAVDYAIQKGKDYNYINDDVYCELFIEQHKNCTGWGEQKIISALLKKGIHIELIKNKIKECYTEKEIILNAYTIAEKKYILLKNKFDDSYKIKQKLYLYLTGRGYSYEIIKKVVDKIVKQE